MKSFPVSQLTLKNLNHALNFQIFPKHSTPKKKYLDKYAIIWELDKDEALKHGKKGEMTSFFHFKKQHFFP